MPSFLTLQMSKKECYEAIRKQYKELTDERRQIHTEKALRVARATQGGARMPVDVFLVFAEARAAASVKVDFILTPSALRVQRQCLLDFTMAIN